MMPMLPETKAWENTPKNDSRLKTPSKRCKAAVVAPPAQRAVKSESLKEITRDLAADCRTSFSKKNQSKTAEIRAPMENAIGRLKTPTLASPSTFKIFATKEKNTPVGEKYLAKMTAMETVRTALPKFMMRGRRVLPKA